MWDKEKLTKQMNFLSVNPNVKLLHSKNYIFHEDPNVYSTNKYTEPFDVTSDYYRLLISDFIVTSTVILDRTAVDVVLAFDLAFIGTEDWEL